MNWLNKFVMILKRESKWVKKEHKPPIYELDILKSKNPAMSVFGSPGSGKMSSIITPDFIDTLNAEGKTAPIQQNL